MKNLNPNIKTIISCMGIAALAFIGVNLISLLLVLVRQGWGDGSNLLFKHGTFYLNQQALGLVWGTAKANGFLLLIFVSAIFYKYRRGQLTFDFK